MIINYCLGFYPSQKENYYISLNGWNISDEKIIKTYALERGEFV